MTSRIVPSFVVILALALPFYAFAASVPDLLKSNGCTGCHAATTKRVGPAWGWVAYRFKGKKDAVETVANFIINGGTGYWKPWTGDLPMPAHHNLDKSQARAIAGWILSRPPIKPPKP